jgi:hypothetical protein
VVALGDVLLDCPSICGEVCPDISFCQICAHPKIKEMVADYIIFTPYRKVNLDDACIVIACGHVFILGSMEGHMSMSDYYQFDADGSIQELKKNVEPFSVSEMKICLTNRVFATFESL